MKKEEIEKIKIKLEGIAFDIIFIFCFFNLCLVVGFVLPLAGFLGVAYGMLVGEAYIRPKFKRLKKKVEYEISMKDIKKINFGASA